MSPEQQIERSVLAGKDREELQTIAGAMGVTATSRMRKADLIDAILTAGGANGANGSDGDAPKSRRVRSARTSELEQDSLAALADEEDALGTAGPSDDDAPMPRPRTRAATTTAPDAAPTNGAVTTDGSATTTTDTRTTDTDAAATSADTRVDPEDERQSFGEGNRRGRRRRRGRGGQEQGGEPRQVEYQGEPIEVQGLLDLRDEGYGFLRASGYLPGQKDVYVSASQVRRFALRKGDYVRGSSRPQASNEKYPALLRVDEINGMTPDDARTRAKFEDLTPLFPDSRLRLELAEDPHEMTGRIVDLIAPIGKGQRGLIVSPPKAGKTTILKQLVYAVERNNPEVHLMVLLVDERPEEVTDMRRHVQRGEVVASTFDRPADEHTQVAELAIERAKRLVEMGIDVVIVLDGITRLARAYNLAAPTSGRIMSGGVDSTALYPPKKFFGAARNIEEGGSLTIVATALIETGSRMDEVIFEEFKGTGNMELRLDRRLSERRIYPSIDVEASSTRHEELLFDRQQLQQVWKLRRVLNALEEGKGLELLIDKIRTTKSNDEFLAEIAKAPTPGS
ncbi:MAG TPA: transcription termination factor Rho [Acidimicrobiia bacterium]|jgi:transcription termination factor Rho